MWQECRSVPGRIDVHIYTSKNIVNGAMPGFRNDVCDLQFSIEIYFCIVPQWTEYFIGYYKKLYMLSG